MNTIGIFKFNRQNNNPVLLFALKISKELPVTVYLFHERIVFISHAKV